MGARCSDTQATTLEISGGVNGCPVETFLQSGAPRSLRPAAGRVRRTAADARDAAAGLQEFEVLDEPNGHKQHQAVWQRPRLIRTRGWLLLVRGDLMTAGSGWGVPDITFSDSPNQLKLSRRVNRTCDGDAEREARSNKTRGCADQSRLFKRTGYHGKASSGPAPNDQQDDAD